MANQHQLAIEYRELMQTIAKTETQVAALRRFAALPPETVAAVKDEASAVGHGTEHFLGVGLHMLLVFDWGVFQFARRER